MGVAEDGTAAQTATRDAARGRLIRWGAGALSDEELLALLFDGAPGRASTRSGVGELLVGQGGLKALLLEDPERLCRPGTLGKRRATLLLAALELGRRALAVREGRPCLRTPADIYRYLAPGMSSLRNEVFHVLCFNSRNVLLKDACVAVGTVNACPVDPREVFNAAIVARASAVVLAHNHPSGDPSPSSLDLQLTEQLSAGGQLLGISVLDHIVVGDGSFVSLLERGLYSKPSLTEARAWKPRGHSS